MKRVMVAALAAMMLLAAAVVAQDETPETTPPATAEATTTPDVETPRIDWASGGIELAADDLQLRVGDTVLSAPGEVLPLGNTYVDDGQLEAWWYEQGNQQRLNINLDLDETDWWVDSIWTYDQQGDDSEWIYFEDLEERTRTPLGEPFMGDLELRSTDADRAAHAAAGAAELELDGLRLSAFMPGTRPAPLTGCDYVVDDRIEVTWDAWPEGGGSWSTTIAGRPLQGKGELLHGWKRMTPKEAEAVLQTAGLCYRVDHSWRPTPRFEDPRLNRELEGYYDRRCSAPDDRQAQGDLVRTRLAIGRSRRHRVPDRAGEGRAGLARAAVVRHRLSVAVMGRKRESVAAQTWRWPGLPTGRRIGARGPRHP